MPTINGKACVANGRNLYLNYKSLTDGYIKYGDFTVTIDPFNSDTNMWHIVAPQVTGKIVGIYLSRYADDKLQDNSDWSYSADVKGTGNIYRFGIDAGSHNPVVGTLGTEWSRISQTGRINNPAHKTLVMYFDTTNSPVDVYIKLPKLEIGKMATPLSPVPVDKVFSDGRQVYGRNLLLDTSGDLIVEDSYNTSQGWRYATVYNGLIAGSVYTFSSEVSVLGTATSIDVRPYNSDSGLTITDPNTTFPIVDGKISGLVKPTAGYTRLIIYAGNAGNTHGNKVTLHHIKLESGNKATDWTPAPEDVM